jgi:hypothetical protein
VFFPIEKQESFNKLQYLTAQTSVTLEEDFFGVEMSAGLLAAIIGGIR